MRVASILSPNSCQERKYAYFPKCLNYVFNTNAWGMFGNDYLDSVWLELLSSVFSLEFRLLFRCPTSLISDFNHWGKPSFLWDHPHLLKHICDFYWLGVCVITAVFFFSMVSEKAAWRASHCSDESAHQRKPGSPPAMCHYVFPELPCDGSVAVLHGVSRFWKAFNTSVIFILH